MAIQFPNFLSANTAKPDYSGIADAISNYYGGKAMPKDDLIKQIQAEFARPNAEQALKHSQLTNQSLGQSITKAAREMQQQAELEKMFRQAFGGSGASAAPSAPLMGGGGMPSQMGGGQPASMQSVNPQLAKVLQNQGGQQQPMGEQPMQQPEAAPQPEAPMAPQQDQSSEPQATIITKGSPHLAGVDQMYDNNPLSRAFLEKKGFKKKQEIKFDNKTGKTSIITTYPSGKVTVQSVGQSTAGDEGIPLTSAMITQHQRTISSVDNALPLLDKLKQLKSYDRFSLLGSNEQNKYNSLVKRLKDNLLGAYGLRATDKGLETAEGMVLIGHGETEKAFRERIDDLIEELKEKKKYSQTEVKRSNKIQPVGRSDNSSSNEDYSDLHNYDDGGE